MLEQVVSVPCDLTHVPGHDRGGQVNPGEGGSAQNRSRAVFAAFAPFRSGPPLYALAKNGGRRSENEVMWDNIFLIKGA